MRVNIGQRFALRLAVTVPPGRSVREQPVGVTVTVSGKGSEILKLRSFPRMIRKTIPDTFSGSVWSIHLQPSDVNLPKGTDVQVADIAPRDLDVLLDSVGKKDVKIVPLVRVEAESGYVLRGLSIVPSVARLVGPEKSLAAIDSVNTLTKDSVRVTAHLVGKAGPGGYARLTVTAPPGIRARVVPDSVALKRKAGRG